MMRKDRLTQRGRTKRQPREIKARAARTVTVDRGCLQWIIGMLRELVPALEEMVGG